MMIQFVILMLLAGIFWGIPSFLFGKYKVLYIDYPIQHILWHVVGVSAIYLLVKDGFDAYFANTSFWNVISVILVTSAWMLVPIVYKQTGKEYLATKERVAYQPAKYSEIVLQQVVILGMLLILDWKLVTFALVFFGIHVVAIAFLPKGAFWSTAPASLFGGIAFAWLQSLGVAGFIASLFIHLAFYATLQSGVVPGFVPYKR